MAKRKSGKRLTKWDRKQFIALDGEGENGGCVETLTIGNKNYTSRDHIYTLLSAWGRHGEAHSLFNGGKRIDSFEAIDWLCDLGRDFPKAIFVIFAGGYDINHIFFGFEYSFIEEIAAGEIFEFEHNNEWYQIQYRPRKSLSLKRGGEDVIDSKGRLKTKWKASIVIWDVFGFFQENFVGVMGKWLGKNHRHYELIKTMKAKRGDFEHVDKAAIANYNLAELECLVEIMEKVHEGISGLGLKCMRFDGAGAVASAMMRKHGIREFKAESPEDVHLAARTAYAGGRIEICKMGTVFGEVYDYDINSAYPNVLLDLPSLSHGVWVHSTRKKVKPGFTLVRCRYDFTPGQRFYPLFYRSEKMQIIFGAKGEGWYWFPEYDAARHCEGKLEVLESWHFEEIKPTRPFEWIKSYYEQRRQWTQHPTEEWQNGAEKIIKLGLNSLYGKTAQQLGGNEKAPAYHQIEWAGYITSATRARLYRAAAVKPESIIGFATDGIFSTAKLELDISIDKTLGAWSLSVFEGLTIAMAGVYWWHLKEGKFGHYSRGFDKDAMSTPGPVWEAWKQGQQEVDIKMYRMLGMGSAVVSDKLWPWRGRFVESLRTLALDGHSHKRNGIDIKKAKPHLNLVDLMVSDNVEYTSGQQQISYPYPLKWLEQDSENAFLKEELEITREMLDTFNI